MISKATKSVAIVASLFAASSVAAAPIVFDITFTVENEISFDTFLGSPSGDRVGSIEIGGTIAIDDALIVANGRVNAGDATTDIAFEVFGLGGGLIRRRTFSQSLNPLDDGFLFDSSGTEIIAVEDLVGQEVDFSLGSSSFPYLSLVNGPVPGTFTTVRFPLFNSGEQEELFGTYEIVRRNNNTISVPAPSSLFLLIVGLLVAAPKRKA